MPKRKLSSSQMIKSPTAKRQKAGVPRVVSQALAYKKVRPEYKVTDVSVIGANSTTAATIQSLTAFMVHGNGTLNGYVGGSIDPQSIQLRVATSAGESSSIIPIGPDTSNNVRVIIFQWLGDSVPTGPDLFQSAGAGSTYSPWNISNIDKINVLMDRTYGHYLTVFQDNAVTTSVSGTHSVDKVYIPGRKLAPISFNSGGTAVTGNDVYICHVSDSSASPHPQVSYYTRMTYID